MTYRPETTDTWGFLNLVSSSNPREVNPLKFHLPSHLLTILTYFLGKKKKDIKNLITHKFDSNSFCTG